MWHIETEYNGVLFRSRTEARWAVFFDALAVPWRYEHEGFRLPSGCYLPDFWLPDQLLWVEIKGQSPAILEERLCAELADATGHPSVLFVGSPLDLPDSWEFRGPACDSGHRFDGIYQESKEKYMMGDIQYWPCICPACGKFGIEFNGRGHRVCGSACGFGPENDKGYTYDHPRILNAFNRVRAHRFWNSRKV